MFELIVLVIKVYLVALVWVLRATIWMLKISYEVTVWLACWTARGLGEGWRQLRPHITKLTGVAHQPQNLTSDTTWRRTLR